MKKQILISLVLLGSVLTMNAQTLYIPNGTGGIGNNTNNSNVGIGVINPQSALEVNGDITLDFKTIYFDRSSNKDHYKISNTSWDDGLRYYHYTAHKFYTQGIERLRIIGNGNVGIGTETPSGTLDLKKLNSNLVFDLNTNGLCKIISKGWNANIDIHTFKNDGSENINQLNLNTNGNVGIGTETPSGTLDLKKLNSNLVFDLNTNGLCKIISKGWNANIDIHTFGSDGSENINQLNLNTNGYVGIGTDTPKYKLDVEGTIRAKEIKVCLQNGCDFVFEKDYKLMSLNELEKFVTTKQHLPEIASEKEMIENGLNMKEFQMKLLQKVEELTLYTIQQNRKIETLDQEFKKLKAENKKLKATKK